MKKTSIFLIALIVLGLSAQVTQAQNKEPKNDTWYVWVDTKVPIDKNMVQIISDEPMVITCCLQSAKYRKFVKKTAKWITENISTEYNGELSLMKIQDKDLAYETIARIKETAGVVVIDYKAVCK